MIRSLRYSEWRTRAYRCWWQRTRRSDAPAVRNVQALRRSRTSPGTGARAGAAQQAVRSSRSGLRLIPGGIFAVVQQPYLDQPTLTFSGRSSLPQCRRSTFTATVKDGQAIFDLALQGQEPHYDDFLTRRQPAHLACSARTRGFDGSERSSAMPIAAAAHHRVPRHEG